MKKLVAILSFLMLVFVLTACGNNETAGGGQEENYTADQTEGEVTGNGDETEGDSTSFVPEQTEGRTVMASIRMENGNEILLELFPQAAPETVANFKSLANSGFYEGVTFHRVVPGFVAQGGDPTGTGTGGPGHTIDCETEGNPHKHLAGALSMAHAGRDTGGSQFFLVHEPQAHLNGVHTVFGQVVEGMDYVLAIEQGDVMEEVRVWEN